MIHWAGSGIYQIQNRTNGHRYVGSTVNLRKRWLGHLGGLRRQRHRNRHLQGAFNRYGEDAFVFSVLEYVQESDNLIGREQHYLDTVKPEYNMEPVAGSPLGVRRSLETRRKMGEAQRGRPCSAETRSKISESLKGRNREPLSEEWRRKLSIALSGERHPNYGKHLSKETGRKIGEANKRRVVTEETKQKMSDSQKAYWRKVHTGQLRR